MTKEEYIKLLDKALEMADNLLASWQKAFSHIN